jgi:predicted ABC-type ATPase
MIKGAAAEVGEVRDWHGVRMQKIAPGHWVPVPKGRAKQGQGEEKEKPAIHGPFEASRKWSQKAPKGIRSYKEGGTQSTYSVVGEDGKRTYTKERKALHDHIVSEYLGSAQPVPEGKQPHAILMMGAPASGKTTMLKKSGLGQHNVVLVAGDEVKEKMPEYTAGVRAGYRGTAGMVHEESSDIAKRVRAEAMEQRKNIVFDGTGADAHKYTKFIKELKEKGYHVTLLMPHIDITEGKRRARARAERSGRWVPSDAVDSGYRNIPGNFFSVAQHVDSAQLYDNSKGPRVVWSKDQEGEKHVDPKFLSKFPNYPGAANAKDPDKARAKTE